MQTAIPTKSNFCMGVLSAWEASYIYHCARSQKTNQKVRKTGDFKAVGNRE